jgi:hypothetical protein
MKTTYNIGQSVTFKTKVFGQEKTLTNIIKSINVSTDKITYEIKGLGQLLGITLQGDEDCFTVSENNIIS